MNAPNPHKVNLFDALLRTCSLIFGTLGFLFMRHDTQYAICCFLAALLAWEWSKV